VTRAALLLLAAVALVHTAEPAVEWTAADASVGVGSTVALTLVYRWPAGWTPTEPPDPAAALTSVFVADLPPPVAQDTAEESRRTWRIAVVPTRSGAWELPRPSFTVRPPTGTPVTVTAPLVVVTVGAGSATAALPAPRPAWTCPVAAPAAAAWPWWAAGTALAGILVGAWWWRRRGLAPPEPPGSLARRALAAAAETAEPRSAGSAASLALRRYAGQVWGFDGAGATTRECAGLLRRPGSPAPSDEVATLLRILGGLDDLRWAPGAVEAAPVAALIRDGAGWVDALERRLAAAEAAR
jgi:hypothetical protein